MTYIKKRTYMVFLSRESREKAIDFLLSVKAKFNYGYNPNSQGLYLIDVSPQVFRMYDLDLHLKGLYHNIFSKFNPKP